MCVDCCGYVYCVTDTSTQKHYLNCVSQTPWSWVGVEAWGVCRGAASFIWEKRFEEADCRDRMSRRRWRQRLPDEARRTKWRARTSEKEPWRRTAAIERRVPATSFWCVKTDTGYRLIQQISWVDKWLQISTSIWRECTNEVVFLHCIARFECHLLASGIWKMREGYSVMQRTLRLWWPSHQRRNIFRISYML